MSFLIGVVAPVQPCLSWLGTIEIISSFLLGVLGLIIVLISQSKLLSCTILVSVLYLRLRQISSLQPVVDLPTQFLYSG